MPPPVSLRQRKSRTYIWQGLALLLAGSVLLLCCKLATSAWMESALLFSGGAALLLGNGYMLYGLLHHADDRVYAVDGEPHSPLHSSHDHARAEPTAPTEDAGQKQGQGQQEATPAPMPQPARREGA